MLRALASDKPKQWDSIVPQAEFAYNHMVNRTTSRLPFSIVYAKSPNYTMDLVSVTHIHSTAAKNFTDNYVQQHEAVKAQIEASNAKYKHATNKHRLTKSFQVGNLVLVFLRKEHFPMGAYHKLHKKKLGPFQVLKVLNENAYLLDFFDDLKILPIFNIADLYPYIPPDVALSLSFEIMGDFVEGKEQMMEKKPELKLDEEDKDLGKSQN